MPTAEEVDEKARETVIRILKEKIRLVACGNGEKCDQCGEDLDYSYRVKDGCLEECAKEIVQQLYS